MTRKTIVLIALGFVFSVIGIIFYKIEIKFLTPTPIPQAYKNVILETKIEFEGLIDADTMSPTFIHFYNPDCPCSRFNVDHFKTLVRNYGDMVRFMVVAQYNNEETLKNIIDQINPTEEVKVILDHDKSIATKLGVYSTPQAVILNRQGELYYRGNYNKSRYCTDPSKFYAQQAIDSILSKKGAPSFEKGALEAYGCELNVEKDYLDKILMFK